nr:RNA-binding S4 domain-containing protein [Nesterenkonia muleiensis]
MIEVPIRDASIRLGQLLKLAGVVDNGAVAREVIAGGVVRVDGEVEDRRGAQIRPGQTVEFHGEEVGLPSVTLTLVSG